MLAYAVKSTIILGAAALLALALRRRSAAARHLVWTAAVVALLALPVLWRVLPALRVPAAATGPTAVFQVFVTGRADGIAGETRRDPTLTGSRAADGRKGSPAPLAFEWIWAGGTALGLLQMLAAWVALWRLRRAARPFPTGIGEDVEILEMRGGHMPMTCGILRPAILMPAGSAEWVPERLRMVLLHELAHVRRGDVATHFLARLALCCYWWNPLSWFAWRQFVTERERAADDLVLTAGERASEYAGHLLEIARSLRPEPATAAAALAIARRSQLEGRLLAILDSRVNRASAGRRASFAAAVAAVVLSAPFAAMQAQDPSLPPELDPTMRAAASQRNHEILDRAAAAYQKLRKFDVAQKLLENSLAIRGQVSGENSGEYAAGLVKLGALALEADHPQKAEAYYRQAVALGDRPEVAKALQYLGVKSLTRSPGNMAAAEDYFERAQRVAPAGPEAAQTMTWLAGIRASEGREPEAESLYQQAIAMQQPELDRATALTRYAGFLRHHQRMDEAQQMEARADQARRAGTEKVAHTEVSSKAYRVGGDVTAPRLLFKVEPQYTEEARAAKISGTVLLYIEVQPDGRASDIRVARSLEPGLDQKAIEAIRQWKFRPGRKDGVPVPVAATIEVNFRLL